MGRVRGKTALVTGAGSGIGAATAILLAEEGANVVVTDIDPGSARVVAESIGDRALAVAHDVSEKDDWERVIAETVASFDRLDILVNNAGTNGPRVPQDPERADLATWQAINRVNLDGVVLGCRAAIPAMRRNNAASIINISSLAADMGTPMFAPYGAGKAAVRQFTKSVALYCAAQGYGIRCNAVLPGFIETPMSEEVLKGAISAKFVDSETVRRKMLKTIPLRTFGKPRDIAYAVLYLASDESAFVTGTEIFVDGGVSAT